MSESPEPQPNSPHGSRGPHCAARGRPLPRPLLARLLRRCTPSRDTLRANPWLGPLAHHLEAERLWLLTPHSTAIAFAVGIFICFLPVPGQTLVGIALGLLLRANLALLFAAMMLGTPIATPPVFYASYRLGAWLLNQPILTFPEQWDWGWLWHSLAVVWPPLWVGALVVGISSATALYAGVRVALFRRVWLRWRRRKRYAAARSLIAWEAR
jgi:uncharacterized protein